MTRHFLNFNYLIITFITSSISALYFNRNNKKIIEDMNDEIHKLHLENNEIELYLKPKPTLQTIVSDIDDYLTLLMKEINESNINDINEDLRNEVHSICNRIIEVIPKDKIISSESFDTLNIEYDTDEDT